MISFTLSNNLILRLIELEKKLAKLQQIAESLDRNELDYIQRNTLISTIGASTRIENAILSDIEISWIDTTLTEDSKTTAFSDNRKLILNKLSKDKERSIDEVAGCRAMLHLVYEQSKELFPFTEVSLRGLHQELLQYYKQADSYSGLYKKVSNSVVRYNGDKKKSVLKTAEPGVETEKAMQELVLWYNQAIIKCPWSIAVAVEFVFRFLAIHPFQDGNGRLGRALFHMVLIQSPNETLSFMTPYLAIDRNIEKKREEYYIVLRRCSNGEFVQDSNKYNYDPFLRFMLKVIEESIADFEFYRIRYSSLSKISDSARHVLNCFKEKPETRLQAKDFVEATSLARATVNEALRVLISFGFIQKYSKGAGTKYQLIF